MIDKIKNNITDSGHIEYKNDGINYGQYGQQMTGNIELKSKIINKVDVEEFNFDSINEQHTGENVTEAMAMEAMKENFTKNKEVTNTMSNEVYRGFKNKIDRYIANNGVDNK